MSEELQDAITMTILWGFVWILAGGWIIKSGKFSKLGFLVKAHFFATIVFLCVFSITSHWLLVIAAMEEAGK